MNPIGLIRAFFTGKRKKHSQALQRNRLKPTTAWFSELVDLLTCILDKTKEPWTKKAIREVISFILAWDGDR